MVTSDLLCETKKRFQDHCSPVIAYRSKRAIDLYLQDSTFSKSLAT